MKREKEENHQAAASDMRAQARRWSGLHGMMDIHDQTTSVLVFGQNNFTITRHFLTTNLMWHFWVFVEFVWPRQNTHWESLRWDNLNPAQCYKCPTKEMSSTLTHHLITSLGSLEFRGINSGHTNWCIFPRRSQFTISCWQNDLKTNRVAYHNHRLYLCVPCRLAGLNILDRLTAEFNGRRIGGGQGKTAVCTFIVYVD